MAENRHVVWIVFMNSNGYAREAPVKRYDFETADSRQAFMLGLKEASIYGGKYRSFDDGNKASAFSEGYRAQR